jgi:hypothetical protein
MFENMKNEAALSYPHTCPYIATATVEYARHIISK